MIHTNEVDEIVLMVYFSRTVIFQKKKDNPKPRILAAFYELGLE